MVYPSVRVLWENNNLKVIKLLNDEDFMNYLLESEGIAGVHGAAFG
jgi:Aspartate/tyrosine/aromatic aminotransferase